VNFDEAFEKLLGHEGGYVNNRADPGGETKFGISKRAYPMEDIAGLTVDRAKAIYVRDYWGPAGCDAMPDGARLQVFDMAVNSGVKSAIKAAQRACGETEDGVLGPLTLQAIQSMPVARFIARFNGARLLRLAEDVNFPAFGRGWTRRVGANLLEA
jgi:lysozyme family protein